MALRYDIKPTTTSNTDNEPRMMNNRWTGKMPCCNELAFNRSPLYRSSSYSSSRVASASAPAVILVTSTLPLLAILTRVCGGRAVGQIQSSIRLACVLLAASRSKTELVIIANIHDSGTCWSNDCHCFDADCFILQPANLLVETSILGGYFISNLRRNRQAYSQ